MPRVFPLRSLALALVVLLPAAPLAYLCRGRTPTRFDPGNLPAWERPALTAHHLSRTAHKHGVLRANVKRKAKAVT